MWLTVCLGVHSPDGDQWKLMRSDFCKTRVASCSCILERFNVMVPTFTVGSDALELFSIQTWVRIVFQIIHCLFGTCILRCIGSENPAGCHTSKEICIHAVFCTSEGVQRWWIFNLDRQITLICNLVAIKHWPCLVLEPDGNSLPFDFRPVYCVCTISASSTWSKHETPVEITKIWPQGGF